MDTDVLNSLCLGHTNSKHSTLFLKPKTTSKRKDRVQTYLKSSKLYQGLRSVNLNDYYEE